MAQQNIGQAGGRNVAVNTGGANGSQIASTNQQGTNIFINFGTQQNTPLQGNDPQHGGANNQNHDGGNPPDDLPLPPFSQQAEGDRAPENHEIDQQNRRPNDQDQNNGGRPFVDPPHNRTSSHVPLEGDSEPQNFRQSVIQPTGEMKNDNEGIIEDVDHTDEYTDGKAPPELPTSETNGKQKQKLEKEKPPKRASNASDDGGSQKKLKTNEEYIEFKLNEYVKSLMRRRKYEKALEHLEDLKNHYGGNKHVATLLDIAECLAWSSKDKAAVQDAISNATETIETLLNPRMEDIKNMAENIKNMAATEKKAKEKTMNIRVAIYYRICAIFCKEEDKNKVLPELITAILNLSIPKAMKGDDNEANPKDEDGDKNTKPNDMTKDFIIPTLDAILAGWTEASGANTSETSGIAKAQRDIALFEFKRGYIEAALKRVVGAIGNLKTIYSKPAKHIVYSELIYTQGRFIVLASEKKKEKKKALSLFNRAEGYVTKHAKCKNIEEKYKLLREIRKEKIKLENKKK
ncbi:uncharacterized protein LOC120330026 [Styela clava]